MKKDESVCALTSGTPTVGGFWKGRRDEAGRQFIDVGIAEENAAAMASGIAAGGGKPLYTVYSTFIQRTYDQISQDICINNQPRCDKRICRLCLRYERCYPSRTL